jgi:ATP-dependent Lon protease
MNEIKLPLVPVRDVVIFPFAQVPISLKREKSVRALEAALLGSKRLFLVMQKDKELDDPKNVDLYKVGTIARVNQVQRLPDGVINIMVEGESRAKIKEFTNNDIYFEVKLDELPETFVSDPEIEETLRAAVEQFRQLISMGKSVALDTISAVFDFSNPLRVLDTLVVNLDLKSSEKQDLLEADSFKARLDMITGFLSREIQVFQTARKIQDKTAEELGKSAKEAFLREELKTIEKELGIREEQEEFQELEKQIHSVGMPDDTKAKAMKELDRLRKMPSMSPEVSYIRTYLDWLVMVPWKKKSDEKIDVKNAEKILNEDHYGLKKVKERILEYLAVKKLTGKMRGPIICFFGPPGVGKTSIARSIARSLNREFVKVSLGGIRDEAEIRGHRRTYVGALPGRIIQGIKDAGTKNPVFVLDEIDKLGYDFRGDPSSALLEALDPEQNFAFSDHYLEVPFDLSDVMFITTANNLDTIPPALRDRMEIIEFPGYTEEEKFHIVTDYLLPKQIENHGLKKDQLKLNDKALTTVITKYTREAGVRNLEREFAAIARKVARQVAEGDIKSASLTEKDLKKFLGPEKFRPWAAEQRDEIGVATGLAWTEAGGEVLSVESTSMPGKASLILTGSLGDVMKESATAAFSYARSKASEIGIPENFYKNKDVHLHVPSGAIPKDGPSAGITMATSIVSMISRIPVRKEVGMTGEITLRGKILDIGGVKEKVLAAHRAGLTTLILPRGNEKDLEEIPEHTLKDLTFHFVDHIDEVLRIALTKPLTSAKTTPPMDPGDIITEPVISA